MTHAQLRIQKRRSAIRRIATDAARNVTASGSVSGDAHNIRAIEHAIIEALNHRPRRKKRK